MCLGQAAKLGPWGVREKGSQGVYVCMRVQMSSHDCLPVCETRSAGFCVHRCLRGGSPWLPAGMCACVFFIGLNRV